MAEELLGGNSEAAAAAEAASSALTSEGTTFDADGAAPALAPEQTSVDDLGLATEPSTDSLPGTDFWDEDKSAPAPTTPDPETSAAPEVQEAKEQAALAALKYKANGVDKEISVDEARKILSQYDGNQKGYKLASQAKLQLKQLQQQIADLEPVKQKMEELSSMRGDHASLIESITGKSMAEIIQAEVEKQNKYQLATPEERAQMDYSVRQAELEARVAKQELQLQEREDQLRAEASQSQKEVLNEKLKSAMSEYYSPNEDPIVDNDLREMVWRTSVAKIKRYHADGYPLSEKLISAVFKKTSKSLGTHRTANVNKEISKISAQQTASATEKAQLASQQNYSSPKVASTRGLNPLDLFEQFVKNKTRA